MKVSRSQLFVSRKTDTMVKVTKVLRGETNKRDVCYISDVVDGQVDKKTVRTVYSDSLRRKYVFVNR